MEPRPVPPLRIAVLGDFDGPHTRRWLRVFIDRGHDVHAISYYAPREPIPGATLHVLRPGAPVSTPATGGDSKARSLASRLPRDLLRLLNALRYGRAGLRSTVQSIAPDVFHAHYAVEHGFYGAFAAFHPYVVSAWGSDLLVESRKPIGRLVARYALSHADYVTAQDPSLAQRAIELGVAPSKVEVARLGIDTEFFSAPESVNLRDDPAAPVIVSDRALEPLYNVDIVLQAFAALRRHRDDARLIVAHDGSERPRLEALAHGLGVDAAVQFVGRLAPSQLAEALSKAQVYVSVPASDSFALSNLEAMACGAFPVLGRLPSVQGMIEDGRTALLVPPGDVDALASAFERACADAALRHDAVTPNREHAEEEGNLERNMLAVERAYYRLARPSGGS